MKKLYIRMLRETRSHFGQFLSIVLIIAVGAMLMSGMFAAITAMDESTQAYYDTQNMADLWTYFKGVSEQDVQQLSHSAGVQQAQGRYTISEQVPIDGVDCTLRLHSITAINSPYLTEGEMPKNIGEIIVDYRFAELNSLTPGSQLTVGNRTLVVSGLCMNPEYAYKQKDASTAVTSNRTFGIGYAQKETLIELIKDTDAYKQQADDMQTKLGEAEAKLEDGKAQLAEAYNEYNTNKASAEQSLDDAAEKLNDTKEKLDSAQTELADKKSQTERQLAAAQAQINDAQKQLDASKQALDAGHTEYQAKRDMLPPEQQAQQDAEFQRKYAELAQKQASLASQQDALDLQRADADRQLSTKQAELNEGYRQYEEGLAELEQQRVEIAAQFNDAKTELDQKQTELSEQETDYLVQKSDAEQSLEDASMIYQEVLFKTASPDTVINNAQGYESYITSITRDSQPSHVNVSGALDPIRSVSYIFPAIFFLVAAVVAFISLSKTVENQRTQIAVMQALGISKARIRESFLAYSALASILGAVPFAIFGNLMIPKLLIKVFVSRFELPPFTIPIYTLYVVLPMLIAILFSGAATLLAASRVLREIPAQAMRPRPPKGTKTILIERVTSVWSRLSYSGKLILRNLFLNIGRILLSSVGIVGSVMLILTGLSLRSSALKVVDSVVDSMSYDFSIVYSDPIEDETSMLYDFPIETMELSESDKVTLHGQEEAALNLQIVESDSDLTHVYGSDGKRMTFDQNSVIIPDSVAKDFGIAVGDRVQITLDDITYDITVTGISLQYASKTMYLTFDSARAAGIEAKADTMLIKLTDSSSTDDVVSKLSAQDGVKNVNTKGEIILRSKDMLKTLNATILLLLISAAVLAVTVIYNITSINIFERTREYATLMVLGYYKKEVHRLTLIENLYLTSFGCLIGLPLGYALFRYLVDIISRSNLRIPTELDWVMVAATIILTFLFAVISNMLLRPKIKKIILVEALKSVE